jgi:hypothetical protein
MDPQEEKDKIIWRETTRAAIISELKNNKTFLEFLEKGSPHSREGFFEEYARKKVIWLEYGPKYVEWNQRDDLKWIENATGRLKEIQQKKLFDAQCLWRAEQLQLKEVTLTIDFDYWEDNIFNCPFIEPVSQDDVEMYIQYLQSSNFEDQQGWFDRWQDYDEIKEAYNSENANRNFPDWYDFHNGRTGLSVYLLLPDVRGPKEEFYMSLWRSEYWHTVKTEKEIMEQVAEVIPVETTKQNPWLDYHKKGWMTWFVNTFEDKETQEVFRRFGGEINISEFDDSLDSDLELLACADKKIPIEGWFDWKEAVHKAAEKYRTEKIIEAMPIAYQQYRINIDMGLGFDIIKKDHDHFEWYSQNILRGRELNGEPRDFNF